jgi:ribonuclease HII
VSTDLFDFDEQLRKEGKAPLAGCDEAGRGPIAGPVVASAVILPTGLRIAGLRDSKKLSPSRRESLFWEILEKAEAVGVGIADHKVIDRINILRATIKAMCAAMEDLIVPPRMIVVDALRLPVKTEQLTLVRAEDRSASVAAASVVAKVTRDRLMDHLHSLYPEYGFNRHRGYATREHLLMLEKLGPSPVHRRTFSPVSSLKLPF